jgi:uncharacterized protein
LKTPGRRIVHLDVVDVPDDAAAVNGDHGLSPLLAHAPLHEQVASLEVALKQNQAARAVLTVAREMALPDWYFGADGVAQTVWNVLHGFDPSTTIKDYDLVYFDGSDLTLEAEQQIEAEVSDRLAGLSVVVDVTNEARVHLWYKERFGRPLSPYRSTGEAITTWPTTASSVGVRYEDDRFVVCAPFGLADLFAMVAMPNKAVITREVYEEKAARWASHWPQLSVLPW